LGEIPPAVRPSANEFAATRSAVHQEFGNAGLKLSESGPDYKRVRAIVDRLGRAAGAVDFTYPVIIADAGKDVNAMAVKDNTMVVYKELLRRVPDDNQLATVLAHEVAHMLAKHGADNTANERAGWVSIGSSILGTAASVGAQAAGVNSTVADLAGSGTEAVGSLVATGTVVRAYDRKLEYEADQVGLMLMAKAGYNPAAAITFWEKAPETFGGDTGGVFLSTHPSTGNRTQRLQEALPKAQEYYAHWKDIENLTPTPAPSSKKKKAKSVASSKDDEVPVK